METVFSIVFVCVVSLVWPKGVWATGTVTGKLTGPHGDTAAVDYSFTKSGSTVTGTTNADGTFSQSLADGEWAFSSTASDQFEYTDTISISRIPIQDGDSFDLGTIRFHYEVPPGTDDMDEIMALPPICSQEGTPVIMRLDYEDEAKGSFLYQGNSANVIVVADRDDYTVEVDYSFIEGAYQTEPFTDPTYIETASSLGNGKYKVTHTVGYAQEGGGMPMVKVTTSGGGSSTYSCGTPGPVNLDIRNFLNGAATTDFTSVADFRAIENFTMHKDGIVKLRFAQNVNMLDPTVQKFMKSIGDKMISQNGYVELDADAVLGLKNAGAVITFYGVSLNNPVILVDGVEDVSGVTSGLTYDKSAGTLTFNTAHFTSFKAVEASSLSSSSSSSSSPTAPRCGDKAPESAPNLFRVDRSGNEAKLFFAPAKDPVSYYYVGYGLGDSSEQFGTKFSFGSASGVLSYVVGGLDPASVYSFKVRAGNGCATGKWSGVYQATRGSNGGRTILEEEVMEVGRSDEVEMFEAVDEGDVGEKVGFEGAESGRAEDGVGEASGESPGNEDRVGHEGRVGILKRIWQFISGFFGRK